MKLLLKLNIISILYAFILFVPIELMVNVYRIGRLAKWDIGLVNTLTFIITIVLALIGTVFLIFLTKNWMDGRKLRYWTLVLWLPYLIFYIYIFANLFPITYGGDAPNPVTGLLIMGMLFVFPLYILIINAVGQKTDAV